jgi:hypothetical protein
MFRLKIMTKNLMRACRGGAGIPVDVRGRHAWRPAGELEVTGIGSGGPGAIMI